MSRVTVTLAPGEREALVKLALTEYRTPPDQARYLLRAELERRGLLREATDVDQSDGGEVRCEQ